jgi:hypothetical protein
VTDPLAGFEPVIRDLPDGRRLSVDPLLLGRARLHVAANATNQWYDDGW